MAILLLMRSATEMQNEKLKFNIAVSKSNWSVVDWSWIWTQWFQVWISEEDRIRWNGKCPLVTDSIIFTVRVHSTKFKLEIYEKGNAFYFFLLPLMQRSNFSYTSWWWEAHALDVIRNNIWLFHTQTVTMWAKKLWRSLKLQSSFKKLSLTHWLSKLSLS